MNDKLNPEVLLEAAEMVSPENEWLVAWEGDEPSVFTNYFSDKRQYFDPRTSDKDLKYLLLALMKEGWQFSSDRIYGRDQFYGINLKSKDPNMIHDESFPLLLLKCVSAQRGIPLYVEVTP